MQQEAPGDPKLRGDNGSDESDSVDGTDYASVGVEDGEHRDPDYEPSSSDSECSTGSSSSSYDSSSDDDLEEYVQYTDKYYKTYPCRHVR